MRYGSETPFGNIESAEQFVKLLIQAIEESRRDVDGQIVLAEANRLKRSTKALRLVSTNLTKLSQHMTLSRQILNRLRTLHRLLLQERRQDNTLEKKSNKRELSHWS